MTVSEKRHLGLTGGIPVGNVEITVGVHSDDANHTHGTGEGMTIGDLATIHEFGAPAAGIPARSFIRGWFAERQAFIQETLVSRMRAATAGKITAQQALDQMALAFEGDVKRRIKSNIPPPLAPATIARKGSSVALIDTSQLVNAIRAKVEVK